MTRNIEIKARVAGMAKLRSLVEKLSETPGELITQEDIFFHVQAGRLKLRVLAADRGELIYYERPNQSGPKLSNYLLARTNEPQAMRSVLASALGIRGVVRKKRCLYWFGRTRIHLDEVDGLGEFVELEVVLQPGQAAEQGQQTAAELMSVLGISAGDLIEGAYIDLLEKPGPSDAALE